MGRTYDITWSSRGLNKVDIYLVRKEATVKTVPGGALPYPWSPSYAYSYRRIASGVSARLRKFSWTIPSNISPADNVFKILVGEEGVLGNEGTPVSSSEEEVSKFVSDKSDDYFSIIFD